ncbi:MAG TPA: hypothetical protein VKB80_35495 [Kofleriaceae bacterium]|nr:hypothetical protein [Kofleriaceae bacterium]
MSLGAVVDALGAFLMDAATPRPAIAGGTAPADAGDLPAVTLSISGATRVLVGVGRIPRPPRTGALQVSTSVNLADPVLRFPGEPDVPLLSNGRRTFQVPHAPLVTADGSPVGPLGDDDLAVSAGVTTFAIVGDPPTGNEVRPDAATGILTFGDPLPASGTLQLAYFIGQWNVRSMRYQGLLGVDVFGADAEEAEALSRSVDSALLAEPVGTVPGLRGIAPDAWGGVVGAAAPEDARVRSIRYRIDYEVEDVVVPTGGGVIARVRVLSHVDGASEVFEVVAG